MKLKIIFFILLASMTLSSCLSNKKFIYFSNIPKDSIATIEAQIPVTRINTNDILRISINSPDAETNGLLNSGALDGYLVDETGMIRIPLLGEFKASGLTKLELSKKIAEQINEKKIALNPIVDVRINNYKITVLGEVGRPGVLSIPNELITLPEVLGLAGDLTLYAQRNNVLLIRESDGKRIYKRFSLNNSQLFDRDFYYLQNKDILYVEPNNVKATQNNPFLTLVLPITASLLSLGLILFNVFK